MNDTPFPTGMSLVGMTPKQAAHHRIRFVDVCATSPQLPEPREEFRMFYEALRRYSLYTMQTESPLLPTDEMREKAQHMYSHATSCLEVIDSINRSFVQTVGFVYLLNMQNGLHKIGRTIHPKQRVKELSIEHGVNIEVVVMMFTFNCRALERILHQRYADKLAWRREYFALTPRDIIDITSLAFDIC